MFERPKCKKHNFKTIGNYGDEKTGEPYQLQRCEHCGKRRKYYSQRGPRSFYYL